MLPCRKDFLGSGEVVGRYDLLRQGVCVLNAADQRSFTFGWVHYAETKVVLCGCLGSNGSDREIRINFFMPFTYFML